LIRPQWGYIVATDNIILSELVKQVRNQLGLSQEELAHKLGVSFSTINRWENTKTKPSKLALTQFNSLCEKMTKRGKLNLIG